MGKASRRQRLQAAAPARRTAAAGARPRVSWLATGAVIAVVAALLIAGRLYLRDTSSSELTAEQNARLPDPDTSGMTIPVARAIRQARRSALAAPVSGTATGHFCQVLQTHWLNDDAAACYDSARALAPQDFRWIYLLAVVEEIRGADGERVVRLFREAIRLAPEFPPLHVRFADALLRLGHWDEARESYATAAALDPELVLAHRGQGQAALLLGDGPTAVEHLERAAALAPDDRIVHVSLTQAYTLTGQEDLAAEAARQARTLTGQAGFPDPVLHQVEILAVDPESRRLRFAQAMRDGDHDQALEAAALLEESGAPSAKRQLAQARKQLANQYAFAGNFDQALAEYARAAEMAPDDPEIQHNWGTVLLRRGELAAARLRFEEAVRLNPRSADSLYNLGVVLEGLGRTDEAIARFTAAAAIDPAHVAAQHLANMSSQSNPDE